MYIYAFFCYIGQCGRKAGCVKPFDKLSKQQLEQELRVREVFDFGNTKKELTQSLKATLQVVQRVPTALLNDPMQTPSDTNLKDWTVNHYMT